MVDEAKSKREELLNELLEIPEDIDEVDEVTSAITVTSSSTNSKSIGLKGKANFYEADKEEMWLDLRNKFIQGKKIPLGNGSYVYKDYSVAEFCSTFSTPEIKLDPQRMGKLIRKFKWREYRKTYLERLSDADLEHGISSELEATYESEVEALTNCKKLNGVLNTYLEFRFGDIIDSESEITLENLDSLPERTQELLTSVNRNTGVPLFLTELKEALAVSERIYSLQRKIIDNNKVDKEYVEQNKKALKASLEDKPLLSEGERDTKLKKLKEKLTKKLSNYTDAEIVN